MPSSLALQITNWFSSNEEEPYQINLIWIQEQSGRDDAKRWQLRAQRCRFFSDRHLVAGCVRTGMKRSMDERNASTDFSRVSNSVRSPPTWNSISLGNSESTEKPEETGRIWDGSAHRANAAGVDPPAIEIRSDAETWCRSNADTCCGMNESTLRLGWRTWGSELGWDGGEPTGTASAGDSQFEIRFRGCSVHSWAPTTDCKEMLAATNVQKNRTCPKHWRCCPGSLDSCSTGRYSAFVWKSNVCRPSRLQFVRAWDCSPSRLQLIDPDTERRTAARWSSIGPASRTAGNWEYSVPAQPSFPSRSPAKLDYSIHSGWSPNRPANGTGPRTSAASTVWGRSWCGTSDSSSWAPRVRWQCRSSSFISMCRRRYASFVKNLSQTLQLKSWVLTSGIDSGCIARCLM